MDPEPGPGRRSLAIILGQLDRAGSERQALGLAQGLRDRGWRVAIFSFRGGPLAEECGAAGIPLTMAGSAALAPFACYQWLRALRPDVAYTFTFRANLWGRIMARLAKVPVRVAASRSVRTYWFDRWTLAWNQGIIANSRAARDLIERRYRLPGTLIRVIANGIDPANERPVHPLVQGLLRQGLEPIVLVARLHPHKDHPTALRALAEISRVRPRVRLILVGDGPERERLAALAHQLGIAERVILAGEQRPAEAMLPGCRLAWLSSVVEGFPNALLEYLAAGLPAIVSRCGGVTDWFEDGRECLLFPPGEHGELARLSLQLLADPARGQELAAAGRALVAGTFSWERSIGETETFLFAVLAHKGEQRP